MFLPFTQLFNSYKNNVCQLLPATIVLVLMIVNADAQDLTNIKSQKPFTIHGNFAATGTSYNSSGFTTTQKPLGYGLMANISPTVYGWSFPFSFIYNDNSKQFTQPFKQIGITPTYKWLKIYAGYSHMTFSPTTLSGKTFLGGGVEMNPGIFRMGAMYGQLNPARIEDTAFYTVPSYRRMGYAGRVGIGKEKNFFDFVYLKAVDDSLSIPRVSDTYAASVTPAENAVAGFNSRFTIAKNISWVSDAAVSIYTRDTRSLRYADIDTGALSKYSAYLKYVNGIISPGISTGVYTSAHSNLGYRKNSFGIAVDFLRIDAGYQSMGLDYIQNDIQAEQLKTNFTAAKNKLQFAGSVGLQQDNLNKLKGITTSRLIYTGNITYLPVTWFGVTTNYTNFNMSQKDGRRHLNDTIRMENANTNFSFIPFFNIQKEKTAHTISLLYNYLKMDDKNIFTSKYANSDVTVTNVSYTLSLLPYTIAISPSFNYTNIYISTTTIENAGANIAINKQLFKNKLNLQVSSAYVQNYKDHLKSGISRNYGLSSSYSFLKMHSLGFTINNMQADVNGLKTSETRAELRYMLNF